MPCLYSYRHVCNTCICIIAFEYVHQGAEVLIVSVFKNNYEEEKRINKLVRLAP